jgi:hypothetical protein
MRLPRSLQWARPSICASRALFTPQPSWMNGIRLPTSVTKHSASRYNCWRHWNACGHQVPQRRTCGRATTVQQTLRLKVLIPDSRCGAAGLGSKPQTRLSWVKNECSRSLRENVGKFCHNRLLHLLSNPMFTTHPLLGRCLDKHR